MGSGSYTAAARSVQRVRGHHRCCGPLATDIAQEEAPPILGKREQIIEVTTDLIG